MTSMELVGAWPPQSQQRVQENVCMVTIRTKTQWEENLLQLLVWKFLVQETPTALRRQINALEVVDAGG